MPSVCAYLCGDGGHGYVQQDWIRIWHILGIHPSGKHEQQIEGLQVGVSVLEVVPMCVMQLGGLFRESLTGPRV